MVVSCIPPPNVRNEIVDALDAQAAVGLLEEIEQLPGGATGALLVGPPHEPAGSVFIENGRVCWAVAQGMQRRLTDLLRHQTEPPLEPLVVEEVYRACLQSGSLLGEELVRRGIVSADGLRRALRQHTSEAMMLLSRSRNEQVPPAWVAHRRQRYDARFTFEPGELLVTIAMQRAGNRAVGAHAQLDAVLNGSGAGAVFARTAGLAITLPIATRDDGTIGVRLAVELGRWAMSALDLANAISPGQKLVAASTPSGASFMTWERDNLVFVALCPDRMAFARSLAKSFAHTIEK